MLRDDLKQAQITAMKAGDKDRLAAVRLILAKVKDRDIELRTAAKPIEDDALVIDVLQKMAKQRRELIEHVRAGRPRGAGRDRARRAGGDRGIPAPRRWTRPRPAPRSRRSRPSSARAGLKDMGRVMAELKARHGTVLDMSKASGLGEGSLA